MLLESLSPPTVEQMRGASGISKSAARDWDSYCRQSRRRFDLVREQLANHFGLTLEGRRVLDWGCAAGGVAILLDDELPIEVHAADVDKHSIRWLREVCPTVVPCILPTQPPLPYGDDHFNAICGISVLTHIRIEMQEPYLAELRRICRPNGLVLLTVAGYHACDRYRDMPERRSTVHLTDRKLLERERIVFSPYPAAMIAQLDFATYGAYGQTFHSIEYIQEVFGRYFEILRIIEGGLDDLQDAVVLTKRLG